MAIPGSTKITQNSRLERLIKCKDGIKNLEWKITSKFGKPCFLSQELLRTRIEMGARLKLDLQVEDVSTKTKKVETETGGIRNVHNTKQSTIYT